MLEQISSFLYNITLGSFPYNIGFWTIFTLGTILAIDKTAGENNAVLVRVNNKLNTMLMKTKK